MHKKISICPTQINNKETVLTIILSIIVVPISELIKSLTQDGIISLIAIGIIVGIAFTISYGIMKCVLGESKKPYRALKEELEYILTLLPAEHPVVLNDDRICPKCPKARSKAR